MDKKYKQTFQRGKTGVSKKHMKICSNIRGIREVQIKITKYNYIGIRVANI